MFKKTKEEVQSSAAPASISQTASICTTPSSPSSFELVVDPLEKVIPLFNIPENTCYREYLVINLIHYAFIHFYNNTTIDDPKFYEKIEAASSFLDFLHKIKESNFADFLHKVERALIDTFMPAVRKECKRDTGHRSFLLFEHQVNSIIKFCKSAVEKNALFGLADKSFFDIQKTPAEYLIDQLYRLYLAPETLFTAYSFTEDLTGNKQQESYEKILLVSKVIEKIKKIYTVQKKQVDDEDKPLFISFLPMILKILEIEITAVEKKYACLTQTAVDATKAVVANSYAFFAVRKDSCQHILPTLPTLSELMTRLNKEMEKYTCEPKDDFLIETVSHNNRYQ